MTSTSSVNYKDSYFEHLVLTTIHREPTYETLHHLKNKLKSNASSAPTNLGGRNNGYLGMVLTPAEYHHISPNNPFTWPHNPGVLVPNLNGTAAQIASPENNHCLTKKLYWETLIHRTTFIQHIIEAIDTKYLAALCNPIIGQIHHLYQLSLSSFTKIMDASPPSNLTSRQPPSKQWFMTQSNPSISSSTLLTTWCNSLWPTRS